MTKLMTTAAVLMALIMPANAGSSMACAMAKHTTDGYVNLRDPRTLAVIRKVYPGEALTLQLNDYDWAQYKTKFKWVDVERSYDVGGSIGQIATKYVYLVDDTKCGGMLQ